jgi:hypothetical protein
MEFLIDRAYEENGNYHVTGICSGDSIKIGSEFKKVYKNILGLDPDGNDKITERQDIRDIKLVVQEIKAYRHSLDELPPGMSGEIVLSGDKGILLKKLETIGII